jgi:hypothetical protein
MKIPVFEELFFKDFAIDSILEQLSESRIGKVPTFINLTNIKKEERISLLLDLQNAFLNLNLNPRFPYPCYIIGDNIQDDYFPVANSVKDLPDHFFKKVKRPNNKELQLLNKLSLKVEKLSNLEMNRIIDNIRDTSNSQKKLYDNTKELYFIEILNYKLIEREKEKEKAKSGKKI